MARPPVRSLLVVGGLPGAGKSTLMRRLRPRADRVVLDSEQVRDALAEVLGAVPYAAWRPLVHTGHWLRVLRAAAGPVPRLVVHEPATAASHRAALALLARLTGRRPRLVLVDAVPQAARARQAERGRVVRPGAMTRHERRWEQLRPAAACGRVPGFASVRLLARRPEPRIPLQAAGPGSAAGSPGARVSSSSSSSAPRPSVEAAASTPAPCRAVAKDGWHERATSTPIWG